ncbi:MAG: long-chain fatty acid--CoA ligase [Candidatus Heimdallarchaeota archaeon]|nr:long-chain fatty acid--CoA ligase [Candidatus Heimdallarchaeota archaeon]
MSNLVTKLNLASVLEDSAMNYPNKTAIVFGETRLTYAQLDGMVNQIANGLKEHDIGRGDKVALSCPNLPYFPMVYYAILKIGATVVPLNVLLKKREITYHLKDSDSKAYFCFVGTEELPMAQEGWPAFNEVEACTNFWIITPPGVASPIEGAAIMSSMMGDKSTTFESVATNREDGAVILYTSGTTGLAKGAELTHSNIYDNCLVNQGLFRTSPDDIHLVALPLFHSFGQTCQMNAGFLVGSTLVLLARFDPGDALQAMQDENVTLFAGVPTMYWALLNYPDADKYDLEKIAKNFRLGASGGSSMPVEVMNAFEEKYKIKILEGYGLSETSPVASFSRMDLEKVPGSIGVPIQGVEMMIADENGKAVPQGDIGEILIRGHNIMKGYYNKPEATAEAFQGGWFHSGDLGRKDEKGYYYIVDRLKDMILRGGFNVYPREIEDVLMTHPAVSLVAVVGEPNEEYGEEVTAFIILKEGQTASPEELIEWSKNEMASYKYPRKVFIKKELPMNATGKILKRVLRDEMEQQVTEQKVESA